MNCLQCKKFFNTLQEELKIKKIESFSKEYLRELLDVKNVNEILSCLLSCGHIKQGKLDKTRYTISSV